MSFPLKFVSENVKERIINILTVFKSPSIVGTMG